MANTKNKFTKQLELGHKEIKGKRAQAFATDAKEDSIEFIRDLESKERILDRKLMDLEDFHVSHTTSLKVTKDGFNTKDWVKEMNDTKLKLALLKERIDIAKEIHTEYFE